MSDDVKGPDHEELGEEELDEAAGGLSLEPKLSSSSVSSFKQPISGLKGVTNASPTTLSGEKETDDELRPRKRSSLES